MEGGLGGVAHRDGHHFYDRTKFLVNDDDVQKKTIYGKTTWIVQRNKKTIAFKSFVF